MRRIADQYELPDYDEPDEGYIGALLRRPRRPWGRIWAVVGIVLALAGLLTSLIYVDRAEREDAFCIGCHTVPEQTYFDRAGAAMAGALAVDLSSYHYQQIRGAGGVIHCINCHEGDGSAGHVLDKRLLGLRNLIEWFIGRNDPSVEKLRVRAPHLSNDGCVACHQETILVAGLDNHYHNMLPISYVLWKNGARLIPPRSAEDVQAIIAAGLVSYNTDVQCSDCHQTHRTLETTLYLDVGVVQRSCVQCHLQVGQGPLEVTVTLEE
ncbi:MAG: hypothetical protein RMN25_01765 [Anaerolineae bacterium]|nr:hypothetical protein [Thermoflexales bacterium]MDW8406482.1 hypothetical protein [Anaerolineae bacterium]